MRIGNKFTDPTNGNQWIWQINHDEEGSGGGKSSGSGGLGRNFTTSAPTSLGINIRQQAADDVFSFSWKGTALTRAQHKSFLKWWAICDHHSIILEDFSGDQFEVMITSYNATRQPVAQNRNDMTNAPLWVYDFEIEMDVIRALDASDYGDAGLLAN